MKGWVHSPSDLATDRTLGPIAGLVLIQLPLKELVRRGCRVHYFLPPVEQIRKAAEERDLVSGKGDEK